MLLFAACGPCLVMVFGSFKAACGKEPDACTYHIIDQEAVQQGEGIVNGNKNMCYFNFLDGK